MYISERILEEIESGTSDEAIALRALMPNGTAEEQWFADFNLENAPLPYLAVIEGETTMDCEGTNHSFRIEKTPVLFKVFATTRQGAADIVEALDNLFQVATLDNITGREVLDGSPFFLSRSPVWKRDNWQSSISFEWWVSKTL